MNIIQCPHCKVRYKERSGACPICNKYADGTLKKEASTLPTKMHARKALLIIVFIILLIPCITILTSNYIHARSFTWSPLVAVILMFVYIYFCFLVAFYEHKMLLCVSLIVTTTVFLFVLDTMMYSRWFTSLALPLTVLWVMLGYIAFMWITKYSTQGFAAVGIALFFIAIALMGTDIVINYEIHKTFFIGWSAISASAIMPVVVVMLFLQRYKKKVEKWLHV